MISKFFILLALFSVAVFTNDCYIQKNVLYTLESKLSYMKFLETNTELSDSFIKATEYVLPFGLKMECNKSISSSCHVFATNSKYGL